MCKLGKLNRSGGMHRFLNPRDANFSLEKFEVNGQRAVYDFRTVDPTDPEEKQVTFSVWTAADGRALDGVQLIDVNVSINAIIDALRFVRENERARRNYKLDLENREPLPFVLKDVVSSQEEQPPPPAA